MYVFDANLTILKVSQSIYNVALIQMCQLFYTFQSSITKLRGKEC